MNGIGNAFIWGAIACGPLFLLLIGLVAAEKALRKSHDAHRMPADTARKTPLRQESRP